MAYFTNNFGHIRAAALTVTIVGVNIWAEIPSGFTNGPTNGFTFGGGNSLMCEGAGTFYLTASASIESASSNQDVGLAYMVNGVVSAVFTTAALFAANNPVCLSLSDIVVLQLGDVVKLVVRNSTGIHNVVVDAASLSIARLQR